MKTLQKYLLVALFLIPIGIFAQTTVNGTVTEKATGVPLPAVNVVVKGTAIGVATDFDGNYSIQANMGDVLVFTYIGFKPLEVTIASTNINVSLEEDASQLDEVVIIGYGSTTRQDATGAIEKVSVEEFSRGAIVSPEQLIIGKTAGVNVIPPNGEPGKGSTIKIRGGNSSLNASNSPLIVVDGVPIDQNGPALNTVNPNDIESFVVLKDASATAIYGSRASAGVILITTKSGKMNAPFKVELSTYTSVGNTENRVDVLSASEYIDAVNATGNTNAIDALGSADTDWQDQIYRTAYGSDTNLTFSQGFENSSYRVSLGYIEQEGVLKTSEYDRKSASFNFRQYLFDNNLKIDLNIRGALVNDDFANGGAIGTALRFDPTQPVFSGSDAYGGYFEWLLANGTPSGLAPRNPVGLLNQSSNKAETERAIGNVKFDYKIPFVDGLKANLNLGFDYSGVDGNDITLASSAAGFLNGGSARAYGSLKRSKLADFYFNYVSEIESINSKIDVTLGHSYQDFYREDDFFTELGIGGVDARKDATQNSLVSYFTRVNYTLDSKYLLTFTYRRDGSSRFSPENRWGNFFSGALAWNISQEAFLQDSNTISNLKLRLGYGETGQQEIGSDFGYLPVYLISQDNFSYTLGNEPYNTVRPNGYDANIKWEESTTYNIGLDYGLFDDRITGSLEYFYRETSDVLSTVSPPAGSNLTNSLFTNIGDLQNSGVEFSIASDIVRKGDFNWNIGFNISYLENEIVKLNTIEDPNSPGIATGNISGGVGNTVQTQKVGQPQSSFLVYKQVYDSNGNPLDGVYEDMNGDGEFTTDDKYIFEDPNADYLMGFSSYMDYKNWDLNFTLRASLGNYAYNNVASANGNEFGLHSLNSNRNVDASFLDTGFKVAQLWSDYYVQDASFLKMDNITLGYNFKNFTKNEKFGLRAYTTVQNVFTITEYDGLDPEVNGGIDNNLYPRPRTFLLGFNVNF